MANSYHQIYLQAVFAVKYRAAQLDNAWRNKLQGVIGNLINEAGCKTIIVNGVEDHIHCFFRIETNRICFGANENYKSEIIKIYK